MAQLLDSDRAQPIDVKAAIIFFSICIVAVIAFFMFGPVPETGNQDMGMKTGEQGLKLGVEEATSHPQLILPR
jgi:hypothetical protein